MFHNNHKYDILKTEKEKELEKDKLKKKKKFNKLSLFHIFKKDK